MLGCSTFCLQIGYCLRMSVLLTVTGQLQVMDAAVHLWGSRRADTWKKPFSLVRDERMSTWLWVERGSWPVKTIVMESPTQVGSGFFHSPENGAQGMELFQVGDVLENGRDPCRENPVVFFFLNLLKTKKKKKFFQRMLSGFFFFRCQLSNLESC